MVTELAQSWHSFSKDEHIPLHEYMMALSIRMVSSTQFGAYFQKPENIKKVAILYHDIVKGYDDILSGKLEEKDKKKYQQFETTCEAFKNELRELIKHHKNAKNNGKSYNAPLLDTILENYDDEEMILGDVATLFIGGFHTTGNLLSWLFYYLAIHPEIQEKVYSELNSVLQKDAELTTNDIPKLQ